MHNSVSARKGIKKKWFNLTFRAKKYRKSDFLGKSTFFGSKGGAQIGTFAMFFVPLRLKCKHLFDYVVSY